MDPEKTKFILNRGVFNGFLFWFGMLLMHVFLNGRAFNWRVEIAYALISLPFYLAVGFIIGFLFWRQKQSGVKK